MTNEEAIKIFKGWAECKYEPTRQAALMAITAFRALQTTLNGTYVSIEWFNAVKAELDALKAKQPTKLDRSRWEAHPVIKRRPYRSERFKEFKLSEDGEVLYRKTVNIHENWTDDYCSACGKKLCSRFTNYCPNCGRPLTEEAWAELERRINGG